MRKGIVRAAVMAAIAGGAVVVATSPALASGQFYQAPGFPSQNSSCMGSAYDYGTHYGVTGDSFPTVVHGQVGPSVSEHATSDGPGAVGDFSSTMAQSHGSVLTCLP